MQGETRAFPRRRRHSAGTAQKVEGAGTATHTSAGPDQGPDDGAPHYGARGPLAVGRPASPAVSGGPGTCKWRPHLGRSQGRHPVAGRGSGTGAAGPGRSRATRTHHRPGSGPSRGLRLDTGLAGTNPPWAEVRMTAGANPGTSVYSRTAPNWEGPRSGQSSQGSRRRRTALSEPRRLILLTARKVGR